MVIHVAYLSYWLIIIPSHRRACVSLYRIEMYVTLQCFSSSASISEWIWSDFKGWSSMRITQMSSWFRELQPQDHLFLAMYFTLPCLYSNAYISDQILIKLQSMVKYENYIIVHIFSFSTIKIQVFTYMYFNLCAY